MKTLLMLFLLAAFAMQNPRTIRVEFTQRTPTDDEDVHVTAFYQEPKETLIFPDINRAAAQFFDLFYSRQIDDDYTISAMVLKKADHEELYIDANNDEDLTREKLEIISFLQTANLELARRMIADKMMQWHHVMLSEEIAGQFKIREYPTNILIAPDGKVLRRTFGINRTFLYQFVQ